MKTRFNTYDVVCALTELKKYVFLRFCTFLYTFLNIYFDSDDSLIN